MAIYVGEGIAVVAVAKDPSTDEFVIDATGTVDFFDPSKAPKTVAADRAVVDHTASMVYDATLKTKGVVTGGYIARVDTTGWTAGKWWYRVTLEDTLDSWEYNSFTLLE